MPPHRRARIDIANGWLSEEIPFIFLLWKRKMWNDADGVRFFACCSPTAEDMHEPKASCSPPRGAAANCAAQRAADIMTEMFSGGSLRGPRCEHRRTTAGLRVPRLRPAQSYGLQILYMLFPPFVPQKVEPKCAAVKRFRGRPCDCAESDACGTFEAIKRSPILNAPSPQPPFVRNRFCRGPG